MKASAVPISTGVTAPVSVLGRAANIHAFTELRSTFSMFSFNLICFNICYKKVSDDKDT